MLPHSFYIVFVTQFRNTLTMYYRPNGLTNHVVRTCLTRQLEKINAIITTPKKTKL